MTQPVQPEWKVPLFDLDFGDAERDAVLRVLSSRWLTMGPETEAFEREFAAFLGVPHAVAVSNGTAALHLAYLALGLSAGDEVLMPSLTFVATANAAAVCGAKPVFAEIAGEDDLTVSAEDLARRITPRTRAIAVMHYGGHACDMTPILALAARHRLPVVEDAAHAVAATHGKLPCGTLGVLGCFSFFSNKNLAMGEGGMVVTRDPALAARLRSLRSHGMVAVAWDRQRGHGYTNDVATPGFNYRMDEIRAALGRVQLAGLAARQARRAAVVARYRSRLASLPGLGVPFPSLRGTPGHHLQAVLLPKGADRSGVMDGLKARGIQSNIHYPPVHRFSAYHEAGLALPVTERVTDRLLTLPLHSRMDASAVDTVCNALEEALVPA